MTQETQNYIDSLNNTFEWIEQDTNEIGIKYLRLIKGNCEIFITINENSTTGEIKEKILNKLNKNINYLNDIKKEI